MSIEDQLPAWAQANLEVEVGSGGQIKLAVTCSGLQDLETLFKLVPHSSAVVRPINQESIRVVYWVPTSLFGSLGSTGQAQRPKSDPRVIKNVS